MAASGNQNTIPSSPSSPFHFPTSPQQEHHILLSQDRNANNKRPLSFDTNDDYLESCQRSPTGERGFATETQIQFSQEREQPQLLQQGQQQLQQQPQYLPTQQSQAFEPQGLEHTGDFLDSAKFAECLSALTPEHHLEAQDITPPQIYGQLFHYHPQQQQGQLAPIPTQNVPFDLDSTFSFDTLLPTPPSISPLQGTCEYPAAPGVLFSPPPPPPPAVCPTPLPPRTSLPHPQPQPVQSHAPRQPIARQNSPRLVRPTMTTVAAAAAFSKTSSSSSSAAAISFQSSSSSSSAAAAAGNSSSTMHMLLPQHGPHATLRLGGFTLEEAGIALPEELPAEERDRRMHLLAQELHHEALNPPILPPSQVPDLPEKDPPVPLPVLRKDMTDAEREDTERVIRELLAKQKTQDQQRNNMAAKKSRLLRLECLENTRLQLNAKAAECAWLRLQMVALNGRAPGGRLPSAAWGGSDFVYRVNRRRRPVEAPRRGGSAAAAAAGEDGRLEYVPVEGEAGEEDEDEDEEMEEEGVVPRRVKEAITEEVRARVEAHKQRLDEEQKKKTSVTRTQRNQAKAAAAQQAQAQQKAAAAKQTTPRRGSKGSSSKR